MGPLAPAVLTPASLLGELLGFALVIAFSPLHICLLLMLLLGPDPLRRGGWFVAGWLLVSLLELGLLLALGHGLLLTMEKGTDHRTGLDLLAAGGLLAVGLNTLLRRGQADDLPGWASRLDGFCAMPLPPLLAMSALVQVISPDDLFLYAKAAASLLAAGFGRPQELVTVLLFSLTTGLLLLLPLAGLLVLGAQRLQPWLQTGKLWLLCRADSLVALVSLALAVVLGVQGVEGLRLA